MAHDIPYDILRRAAGAHLSVMDQIRLEIAIRDKGSLANIRMLNTSLQPSLPPKLWDHPWYFKSTHISIEHKQLYFETYDNVRSDSENDSDISPRSTKENVILIHCNPHQSGLHVKINFNLRHRRMRTYFHQDLRNDFDPGAMDTEMDYICMALYAFQPFVTSPPKSSTYFNCIRRKPILENYCSSKPTPTKLSWKFIRKWAKKLSPIFTKAPPYMVREI